MSHRCRSQDFKILFRWLRERLAVRLAELVVESPPDTRFDPYTPTVRARLAIISSVLDTLSIRSSNSKKVIAISEKLARFSECYTTMRQKWREAIERYRVPRLDNHDNLRHQRDVGEVQHEHGARPH